MSLSALANRCSARMGDALGGAFHVTYVENLPGIVRCGLVPGGIGGGNRLALCFGAFAPWDKANLATKTTLRNLRVGDPIAIIYIPSATLARYGAGVAFNGTFMVFDVVPFCEVKSIWIGKSNEGKCLEIEDVKRAYSKCVENEICPGFVGSSQESAITFLQNIAKVIEESPEMEAGADNLHYIREIDSDDDDDHKPNVSGDARRAQEEANDNAAAQEKGGGMEDDPEDDDMGTQEDTSGYVSEEEDNEWNCRDNDMAARDIINSQRMAICMDEPREAQYMAGFIALQMSRLWGMFEAGEKRANDAALEGIALCPYHNDLGRYPNITEFDRDGVILASNEHKISQSHNVRTRTYRTVGERTQHIRYLALK